MKKQLFPLIIHLLGTRSMNIYIHIYTYTYIYINILATGKLRASSREPPTTRLTSETMTLIFNRKRKDPEYPDA